MTEKNSPTDDRYIVVSGTFTDRNGFVSTNDALEILNYALRKPNYDAEWVFIDTEADLDRISRR